jgi:hypothetical protein
MDATQIPPGFSHVHFAFAATTNDFQVDLSAVQDQFDKFVNLEGFKRILSLGGWSFSTSQVRAGRRIRSLHTRALNTI